MGPFAVLTLLGLGVAGVMAYDSAKSSSPSRPNRGVSPQPFSNGMAADLGLPADTRAMVETAITLEPDPPGPGGYQVLVNAITHNAATLEQTYPLAAAALMARWRELRAEALAAGWRLPDSLDSVP